MVFSSLTFLFVFLPLTLISYYLTPKPFRNHVLSLFSLFFYAWGGVSYSIIFILSILINYLIATRIIRSTNRAKLWLKTGISFNILLLFTFKYINFFIENLNLLNSFFQPDSELISTLKIVLPIGISFFTFQQMSLLWDIYREKGIKKINLVETTLYVSLFPQLIAGPIVRYHDIIDQIRNRIETLNGFNRGIERFVIGLFKKVILANTCAIIADDVLAYPIEDISMATSWLGIGAYSLQIFFDFSGYSDMAIGLGLMFGFNIPENFNFPYLAKSIKDFWRKWHISLSNWFKDYVYIPLGGNKISTKRTYLNLLIVFALTGFWHGATWSFVFWGLFHGFFLIVERMGLDKILKRLPNFLNHLYVLLIVITAWVFFRIPTILEAGNYVMKLYGLSESGPVHWMSFLNTEKIIILIASIFIALYPLNKNNQDQVAKRSDLLELTRQFGVIILFLYCVLVLNSGSYNPFIYFQF